LLTLWASITAIALVALVAFITLFTLRPLWAGWSRGASSTVAAAGWYVSLNNRSHTRLNVGVFNVDPKRVCDAGIVINFAADAGSAQLSEKLVSVVGQRKAYASGHGLPLFAAVNFRAASVIRGDHADRLALFFCAGAAKKEIAATAPELPVFVLTKPLEQAIE
jgi:hypothetical protein